MARYWCERCGAESNTLSDPHVCKDVAARLKRRNAQADAVEAILRDRFGHDGYRGTAEAIVTTLARMGVADE